jgi:ethanolamine-phosphate phospho-lyase
MPVQRLDRLIHLQSPSQQRQQQQQQQPAAAAAAAAAGGGTTPASASAVAAAATDGLSKEEIYALRKRHFSDALSVSYENTSPLLIVRGERQRLFDEQGVSYLDTRNNVGHVGHSNPKVAAAVAAQVGALNTNTRYLHPNVSKLAEKLTATMPDPLSVVFFVNSGSEANDLAMRLARAHTGNDDFVVVEHAYHGHTTAVIDISPYKYEHKGGEGQKPWVHKVPCPDTYRGIYGEDEPDVGEKYASFVATACEEASARTEGEKGVAGFFIESGMSVAGVILPPEGYLQAAYKHVRKAGGVCIADEVQVTD